jgi:cysteine desulfuration protein SufE
MNSTSDQDFPDIEQILDDFEFLDDWEDRYRYVIELGRKLPPFDEAERTAENKVQGCVSQVWLSSDVLADGGDGPRLVFQGDSDAHIVRGLIAVLFAIFNQHTPEEILKADPSEVFVKLGLREHLTPQRSNGLNSMVERVKRDARQVQQAAAAS